MSGHNVETIKDLMDERDKRYEQRFVAQEQALRMAEAHAEQWRNSANEWREAMTDRERQFLSKGMGYIVGALSILGLVLTIADKFK